MGIWIAKYGMVMFFFLVSELFCQCVGGNPQPLGGNPQPDFTYETVIILDHKFNGASPLRGGR